MRRASYKVNPTTAHLTNKPTRGIISVMKENGVLELIGEIRSRLDKLKKMCAVEVKPVTLWCDGGSKGNPGLGYCSYAFDSVHETVQLGDNVTNNSAEYEAVLKGVRAVVGAMNPIGVDLTINTDSALVVGQLMKGWKVNAVHLKPLISKIRSELGLFHSWSVDKALRKDVVAVLGH